MRVYTVILALISTCIFASESESLKNFEKPIEGMLPYFQQGDLSPTWTKKSKKLLRLAPHQAKSQISKSFGTNEMMGKLTVINFFFATCPGYCPRITSNIKKVFEDFKEDKGIQFASYSVTPSLDKLKVLTEYAERYEVNKKNWHFVRAKKEVVYNLARKNLFADLAIDLNKEKDEFVHTESIYLIDQDLYVRGIYNSASRRALMNLKKDIQSLQETSQR